MASSSSILRIAVVLALCFHTSTAPVEAAASDTEPKPPAKAAPKPAAPKPKKKPAPKKKKNAPVDPRSELYKYVMGKFDKDKDKALDTHERADLDAAFRKGDFMAGKLDKNDNRRLDTVEIDAIVAEGAPPKKKGK